MKGIGVFVSVLLIGMGIVTYILTRPPDRNLDAEEQAWVDSFSSWREDMAAKVDRAEVEIGVSRGERLSAQAVRPLRGCAVGLRRLGEPPPLLVDVLDAASRACGEVAYAISVHTQYGRPALATTRLHLRSAGNFLDHAQLVLERRLAGQGS